MHVFGSWGAGLLTARRAGAVRQTQFGFGLVSSPGGCDCTQRGRRLNVCEKIRNLANFRTRRPLVRLQYRWSASWQLQQRECRTSGAGGTV